MKILFANKRFYITGGVESSFFQTAELLKRHGHTVFFFSTEHRRNMATEDVKYFVSSVDYEKAGIGNKIDVAFKLLYSFEAKKKIDRLIRDKKPELAHLASIYHQISPSILHVIKKYDIPVVMTLHDYKMVCASYLLFNGMDICEACGKGRYFQCVLKKCVKNSRAKSLLNTIEMYLHHRFLRIYDLVDVFISPSRFLKSKLEEMGFKGKIVYLPNPIKLEAYSPEYGRRENSIVYFGRLSGEKGLFTLLEAVKGVGNIVLKIIGEGPMGHSLEEKVKKEDIKNVRFMGYKTGEELKDEIKKSMFIILPSICYENNPLAIIEGFALGKPAIASNIGGIPELVKAGETGLTFKPGDAADLRSKIEQLSGNPSEVQRLGKNARSFVEKELDSEIYYDKLIKIYSDVIEHKPQDSNQR